MNIFEKIGIKASPEKKEKLRMGMLKAYRSRMQKIYEAIPEKQWMKNLHQWRKEHPKSSKAIKISALALPASAVFAYTVLQGMPSGGLSAELMVGASITAVTLSAGIAGDKLNSMIDKKGKDMLEKEKEMDDNSIPYYVESPEEDSAADMEAQMDKLVRQTSLQKPQLKKIICLIKNKKINNTDKRIKKAKETYVKHKNAIDAYIIETFVPDAAVDDDPDVDGSASPEDGVKKKKFNLKIFSGLKARLTGLREKSQVKKATSALEDKLDDGVTIARETLEKLEADGKGLGDPDFDAAQEALDTAQVAFNEHAVHFLEKTLDESENIEKGPLGKKLEGFKEYLKDLQEKYPKINKLIKAKREWMKKHPYYARGFMIVGYGAVGGIVALGAGAGAAAAASVAGLSLGGKAGRVVLGMAGGAFGGIVGQNLHKMVFSEKYNKHRDIIRNLDSAMRSSANPDEVIAKYEDRITEARKKINEQEQKIRRRWAIGGALIGGFEGAASLDLFGGDVPDTSVLEQETPPALEETPLEPEIIHLEEDVIEEELVVDDIPKPPAEDIPKPAAEDVPEPPAEDVPELIEEKVTTANEMHDDGSRTDYASGEELSDEENLERRLNTTGDNVMSDVPKRTLPGGSGRAGMIESTDGPMDDIFPSGVHVDVDSLFESEDLVFDKKTFAATGLVPTEGSEAMNGKIMKNLITNDTYTWQEFYEQIDLDLVKQNLEKITDGQTIGEDSFVQSPGGLTLGDLDDASTQTQGITPGGLTLDSIDEGQTQEITPGGLTLDGLDDNQVQDITPGGLTLEQDGTNDFGNSTLGGLDDASTQTQEITPGGLTLDGSAETTDVLSGDKTQVVMPGGSNLDDLNKTEIQTDVNETAGDVVDSENSNHDGASGNLENISDNDEIKSVDDVKTEGVSTSAEINDSNAENILDTKDNSNVQDFVATVDKDIATKTTGSVVENVSSTASDFASDGIEQVRNQGIHVDDSDLKVKSETITSKNDQILPKEEFSIEPENDINRTTGSIESANDEGLHVGDQESLNVVDVNAEGSASNNETSETYQDKSKLEMLTEETRNMIIEGDYENFRDLPEIPEDGNQKFAGVSIIKLENGDIAIGYSVEDSSAFDAGREQAMDKTYELLESMGIDGGPSVSMLNYEETETTVYTIVSADEANYIAEQYMKSIGK